MCAKEAASERTKQTKEGRENTHRRMKYEKAQQKERNKNDHTAEQMHLKEETHAYMPIDK